MRPVHFCTLCLVATLWFLSIPAAHAAYIANINQVGPDVVASGIGSLDLTDLTLTAANNQNFADLDPQAASIALGPPPGFDDDEDYGGVISGPISFGSGPTSFPTSGSGPFVSIEPHGFNLYTPPSYVSGSAIGTTTDTYSGQTFASLGITPGTYVETWGSGIDADSFTINIGVVPEPASLSLLALAGIAMRRRSHS